MGFYGAYYKLLDPLTYYDLVWLVVSELIGRLIAVFLLFSHVDISCKFSTFRFAVNIFY